MPAATLHKLVIPDWQPTPLNKLLGHWRRAARLKKLDREMIAVYARLASIPLAIGKRRVSLTITLGPRQRGPDPDSFFKSLLDALVSCGLLLDDNRQNVELVNPEFVRGERRMTEIVLEDLE